MHFLRLATAGTLALVNHVAGIEIKVNDSDGIKSAAATIAHGMVSYYHGNESGLIPGELGDPYYWWEAGAMLGSLINYWYYTGDTTYNDIVKQGMIFQVGPEKNYMPPNQTKAEGNDDQYFWGNAAMSAAELNFPNPDTDEPQWLALAQAVFNTQALRWDNAYCAGGLRWQIFTWNNGYDYKNTASNGGLFNLAARLGVYTGNDTYFDWAVKAWDWLDYIGLIGDYYDIYDGSSISDNCTSLDHTLWTYNSGMLLNGAATMWKATNDAVWKDRTLAIWNATARNFFTGNQNMVMRELCEPTGQCNVDQQSFKAYLSRFIAASAKLAPWLYDIVRPYIEVSAVAAGQQCDGGANGNTCGLKWTDNSTYDGSYGVGQQMAALEITQALLIQEAKDPVTAATGGTSTGDPNAGTGDDIDTSVPHMTITTSDRAGAGIITAMICVGLTSGGFWMATGV